MRSWPVSRFDLAQSRQVVPPSPAAAELPSRDAGDLKPRLTVSRKVFLLLLLPLLILVVFTWAITDLRRMTDARTAALARSKDVTVQTQRVLRGFELASTSMDEFALTREHRFADESAQALNEVRPQLDRLAALLASSHVPSLTQVRTSSQRLVEAIERLRAEAERASQLDAPEVLDDTGAVTQALDDLHRHGRALLDEERQLDEAHDAAFQRQWNMVDHALIWGTVFAVLLTLLLGRIFGRSISDRLGVLAANAERVAGGDPLLPQVAGRDEIGVLDRAFHEMAEELKRASGRERALMDNVAEVICSFDLTGRFTAVSPASLGVFGFRPSELVGRSWIDLMVPEPEADASRQALAALGKDRGSATIESRCRRRDGRLISVAWSATWSSPEGLVYAVARDVTERIAAASERQFYLETIDRLDEAIFELDHDGIVRQMSRAWRALSGFRIEDVVGTALADQAHPEDRTGLQKVLAGVLGGTEPLARLRFRLRRAEVGEGWVDAQLLPHRDAHGAVIGVRGLLRDVTEEHLEEQRITRLALHDSLTQLPNRVLFDDRLQVALGVARRTRRRVALAFVDVDDFKQINDRLGHATGDQVLQRLAQSLSAELRKGDTLARWGGDEFVVLLPDLTHEAEASAVARRLLDAAASASPNVRVTLSIGIALFPDHAGSPEELIQQADRAMFLAKRSGRNNVQTLSV